MVWHHVPSRSLSDWAQVVTTVLLMDEVAAKADARGTRPPSQTHTHTLSLSLSHTHTQRDTDTHTHTHTHTHGTRLPLWV